ncbi:hypothetical protein GW17_00036334 [Ensete ventricosum]|nr:hypothetical protein GW17_00036334 [Ensete ventricosum]RZR89069.1 hypothetical protein BHM03_00016731 [Ensete ventricosum]
MVHGVGPRKETRPNVLSSSSGPAPTAGAHLVVSRAKRRLLGFATFFASSVSVAYAPFTAGSNEAMRCDEGEREADEAPPTVRSPEGA